MTADTDHFVQCS